MIAFEHLAWQRSQFMDGPVCYGVGKKGVRLCSSRLGQARVGTESKDSSAFIRLTMTFWLNMQVAQVNCSMHKRVEDSSFPGFAHTAA